MHIELPQKEYYKIGEVAKAFNLSISMIRYWEREFEMIKPKRDRKGVRFFTQHDVENFKLIHHLAKEQKYSLEGVRKKLKENKEKTIEICEIVDKLESIKFELIKIKKHL